ncbi:hypothetical protein DEO72_LG6g1292 [Vigna unguiculata]|uniref:Uncharacterized protein n=1 Tax=Vigna unguiculata TaxID=3917 RepID=A0A4D6M8Y6_VIGUN|nr:hypothetical protein DEO72_LG6g1292 [Vigna unguiculata]
MTSGVERSTTATWLCGGSRVPNQQLCLREQRAGCSNGERVARTESGLLERKAGCVNSGFKRVGCTNEGLHQWLLGRCQNNLNAEDSVFDSGVERRKKKRNSGARRRR